MLLDDAEVAAENYTASDGSIVVDFKPAYLEALALGPHAVEIASVDGSAYTTLTILPKEEPKPTPTPAPSGDDLSKKSSSGGTSVVTCQDAGYPANYAWNEAAKACQPGYIDNNGVFHATTNANGRYQVANTNDNGLGNWVITFLVSGVMAIGTAYVMRKH